MMLKRNILLNPGPATTTETVKMAQVVPDICPREKEFGNVMQELGDNLLKVVHADRSRYCTVLFCGSGTLNMDVCLNSLLPEGKKLLIVNNGAYSTRAVQICRAYGLDFVELRFPVDELPDLDKIAEAMKRDPEIAVVYATHQETGTGVLNPVREIGDLTHAAGAALIVDTTSTFAMLPMDLERDNIDFCMASAQKGLQAMTGLSFVVGRKDIIEASKDYPVRSYYCNLFQQYDYFRRTGQMRFTPPVQTIYAARQAMEEYFAEGEVAKWKRHCRVMDAIHEGMEKLGFREAIRREIQAGLVASVLYPDDGHWDFEKLHDYCYERGFTMYPGKMQEKGTFRLCALGAIDETDIKEFFAVFEAGLRQMQVRIPVSYGGAGNDWKRIWNKRKDGLDAIDKDNIPSVYMELKRLDGFDIDATPVQFQAWYEQYLAIKEKLSHARSVFEVGCGSGANLYLFHQDGIEIGGMDYSQSLIDAAHKIFAEGDTKELLCGEAIHLSTEIKYDAVLSVCVFHYFPDIGYAEAVLEKMLEKANRTVGVLMVHDQAREADFLEYRRSLDPDYDERYKGLPKLHFSKAFFSDFANRHNLEIEFAHLPLDGFWDNDFIFDVFMYKKG